MTTKRVSKPKNPKRQSAKVIMATESDLAAAFTEWDRRYREEPERYMSEATRLLRETPKTYGAACAPYLIHIINELRGTPAKG